MDNVTRARRAATAQASILASLMLLTAALGAATVDVQARINERFRFSKHPEDRTLFEREVIAETLAELAEAAPGLLDDLLAKASAIDQLAEREAGLTELLADAQAKHAAVVAERDELATALADLQSGQTAKASRAATTAAQSQGNASGNNEAPPETGGPVVIADPPEAFEPPATPPNNSAAEPRPEARPGTAAEPQADTADKPAKPPKRSATPRAPKAD